MNPLKRLEYIESIMDYYTNQGAYFVANSLTFIEKLENIKAYIFDWDGVFNDGIKTVEKSSGFSETDAMGINLVKFNYWKQNQINLYTAIITGTENPTAIFFAERSHFHATYSNVQNKKNALEDFLAKYQLNKQEVLYIFDDVIDFNLAKEVGLRFLVRTNPNRFFFDYAIENSFVEYITSKNGGQYAIREITEMILQIKNQYHETLMSRYMINENWKNYYLHNKQIKTEHFNLKLDS